MKEKIYIIFKNNEEEYDDYSDWIIEIYKDKERAEKRFVELVKTNQYKKDRTIRKVKYNEDIGAYRIEEHEIESEERQDEVIDTNSDSIEEDIKNAEHFIKSIKTDKEYKEENGWHGYYNKEIVELARILEHILSDYKRVLKENEELTISNKEIDKECNRLEAKEKSRNIEPVVINNKMYFIDKNLYEDLLNDIKSNYIPIQKIKDKIEALKKQDKEWTEELSEPDFNFKFIDKQLKRIKNQIDVLQELLESEKK